MSRRPYIDWLRGVAVLAMIEWHVLDAWSLREGRDGFDWVVIQTVGGYAAPLFLFLAGLSVPLAISARSRRGASLEAAAWSVQKRGWQVFGIAHLFRVQSFLLNPNALWSGLLKPDILNILGLGLAGTAWLCGRALRSTRRALWLVAPAIVILALTPASRHWWWPTLLHPRLEAYIRPVGNFGVFSVFPWAAYVPFGAYLGALLVDAREEQSERRLLRRLTLGGFVAFAASMGALWLPVGAAAAGWVYPTAHIVIKTGIMTMALAASRWVVAHQPAFLTNPVLLLGQTSLFVYWVHVEFAYGVWSSPLHSALPLRWSLLGFAAVLVAMYFAARWWANRPRGPWIPAHLYNSQLTIHN